MRPGDVVLVYLRFIHRPDNKFLVCVDFGEDLYFSINSDPYLFAPEAQVLVTPQELSCLAHDSFIDTSKFLRVYKHDIDKALQTPGCGPRGRLPTDLLDRIREVVKNSDYLSPKHIEIVLRNL
jgi:hypothetical protein